MNTAEWVSWDRHRRSVTLAEYMGISLSIITRSRHGYLNPWLPLLKSVRYLCSTTKNTIIVQNPSLVLTILACLIKPLKGYRLIQDLHSYFIWIDEADGFRARLYRMMAAFCLRNCDLTIVTNPHLASVVGERGGRGFVLQDRIPDLVAKVCTEPGSTHNVVFICTYSEDEPLEEVLDAARKLGEDYRIYVTGRPRRRSSLQAVPANVTITGFLSEREYVDLLNAAEALISLTTCEHTLLCGAYEAVALSKPLILSATRALRDYFTQGVIYVSNDAEPIAEGIREAVRNRDMLTSQIVELKKELNSAWDRRFEALMRELECR